MLALGERVMRCRSIMRGSAALILMYIAALTIAGCAPATKPTPATTTADATTSVAPSAVRPAVFYAKGGALYVSDPAGTAGRKVTDGPLDAQPAPSPDGAHVAFIRNAEGRRGELWVLDLSPDRDPIGAPRRLVDPAALPPLPPEGGLGGECRSPRWSPTGKQIAFLESTVGGGFILVAAADTGAIVPLERPLSMSELAADEYTWAPDGTHIAWRAAAPRRRQRRARTPSR
jgi:TolB protein